MFDELVESSVIGLTRIIYVDACQEHVMTDYTTVCASVVHLRIHGLFYKTGIEKNQKANRRMYLFELMKPKNSITSRGRSQRSLIVDTINLLHVYYEIGTRLPPLKFSGKT